MVNKEKCIMLRDKWYLTIEDAAEFCSMDKMNLYKQRKKFNTVTFAGVMLIEMEELTLFNNVRIYKSILKNREVGGKDEKTN